MNKRLKPQLANSEEIKSLLRKVNVTFTFPRQGKVDTLLVYLGNNGQTDYLTPFFEAVKNGIMANFVFKCSEIERKLGIRKEGAADKLFDKAIRKLSQHTAKGELVQLILFTLLDVTG